jgi:hypothetical protein
MILAVSPMMGKMVVPDQVITIRKSKQVGQKKGGQDSR